MVGWQLGQLGSPARVLPDPAGWPGLVHMVVSGFQIQPERTQQCVYFKLLKESHLVMSHYPKQVTWLPQIKGMGKETPPLGGNGKCVTVFTLSLTGLPAKWLKRPSHSLLCYPIFTFCKSYKHPQLSICVCAYYQSSYSLHNISSMNARAHPICSPE